MARYDTTHKAETRRRILDTAAQRFKRHGIDGSGVAGLMSDAGLTNGAFYAHFGSKSDLVAAVVADQLDRQTATMNALPPGREALAQFIRGYLSPGHRDQPEVGCPSAALLDEIVRCGDDVRGAYTAGVRTIIEAVTQQLSLDDPTMARQRATGLFALLVGTLQLARAVDDPAASEDVLEAGINTALELLGLEASS